MKKLFALLMAVVMMFSLATVAFAEEAEAPAETKLVSDAITFEEVFKAYEVVGSTDEALYPAETLKFEVKADEANPDATVITVDDLAVSGNADQLLTINVPSYEKVGVYKYTISEVAGTTQGVTYTQDTIDVTVLVTYNYEEGKLDTEVVLSTPAETEGKVDTFTNTYKVGKLTVNKTVTGNLADQTVEFEMTVTFKSEGPVLSDITVNASEGESTITGDGWTEKTVTINVKHGETVTFDNIPVGVTYEVVEAAKHGVGEDGFDVNSAVDTDYTVTYTAETGTISADVSEAKVVNEKKTTVDTGIVLDSMPYVVILAVACFGMVAMMTKKRYEV